MSYSKKFSDSLMKPKNYAGGGEVTSDGWLNRFLHAERPGLKQLNETLHEPNDLYDRATKGSIYNKKWRDQDKSQEEPEEEGTEDNPRINTAPAEKVDYSPPPETTAEGDDEEYRKGGPVKKRRK